MLQYLASFISELDFSISLKEDIFFLISELSA